MGREDHSSRRGGHGRKLAERSAGWLLGAITAAHLWLAACGSDTATPPPPPPPSEEERLSEAWERYRGRRYEEARNLFTAMSADFPGSDAPWLGIGWSLARLDSFPAAEAACDSALDRRQTEDIMVARAIIQLARGRDDAAIASLDAGYRFPYQLRWDPTIDDRTVAVTRGLALFNLGRYQESLAALQVTWPDVTVDLEAVDLREQLARLLAALEAELP